MASSDIDGLYNFFNRPAVADLIEHAAKYLVFKLKNKGLDTPQLHAWVDAMELSEDMRDVHKSIGKYPLQHAMLMDSLIAPSPTQDTKLRYLMDAMYDMMIYIALQTDMDREKIFAVFDLAAIFEEPDDAFHALAFKSLIEEASSNFESIKDIPGKVNLILKLRKKHGCSPFYLAGRRELLNGYDFPTARALLREESKND